MKEVLPDAEHRLCARHIYANWSKAWRGGVMKERFFSCAWSTFEEQFKDNLKALDNESRAAAKAAVSYPVKAWVRAYFSNRCLSQSVDNNISESLNSWIDEYRYLPVIRMFDGIRVKMMEKWARSEQKVRNWRGDYSPKCLEIFDANRKSATRCRVRFNGDEGYEVSEGQDRHTVSLSRKMCTCRRWDLTGIPCQHSITAMWHAKIDPIIQISRYYHKETYISTYRKKFEPVRGKNFWDIDSFDPMLPPPVVKLPGRPSVKRKRTEEARRRLRVASHPSSSQGPSQGSQVERFSKIGRITKCTFCRKEGHNRSTCKEVNQCILIVF